MVFLVKAPPHPLKPKLEPLPPDYYDPTPPPHPNLNPNFDFDSEWRQRQGDTFLDYNDYSKKSRFDSGYQQNSQRKPLVCYVLILEMVNE